MPCPSKPKAIKSTLESTRFFMRSQCVLSALLLLLAAPSFGQASHVDAIDKSADPCQDFYQYTCGNWLKSAEIPADQTSWSSFVEIRERNAAILREILEKSSAPDTGRDAIAQKIGDFYGSCVDEKTVDAKGVTPLKPELDRIAKTEDKTRLIDAV